MLLNYEVIDEEEEIVFEEDMAFNEVDNSAQTAEVLSNDGGVSSEGELESGWRDVGGGVSKLSIHNLVI
jgi:midasin (ATPase involved in ribosome maturation)